jgi:hypothetical protein
MFAPDHRRAAGELLRVCRPGGTIGLLSWTPEGTVGRMFATLGRYVPVPSQPPVLWGSRAYLADLFGDRVEWAQVQTQSLPCEHFAEPRDLCEYYKEHFGPTMAVYDAVRGDDDRLAALERDFLQFATQASRGGPGRASYEYEYLLACGHRG